MDPISFTASIIAILQLTSSVVGYLSDVKDAPKDRARCATEASNLFNLLTDLRYRLEGADTSQAWFTALWALASKGGPFDQYKSALEQLTPKVSLGSGIMKIGNALVWTFSKQEVNVILSRIERLKTLVQIALEMDHFKLSQAIKSYMDTLHSDNQAIKDDTSVLRRALPTLEAGATVVQQEHERQRHRTITDWISSIDFAAQQSSAISQKQEGTGIWFTDSPEFLTWLHGSKQTLFCPGIPGAGKTMIAAIVVDYLWRHAHTKDIGVAYIYCNYKRIADQRPTDLAATVLKQLVQERPSIPEPVVALHDYHLGRGTRPSFEEILSALQKVVSSHSKVYVVVDALDECLDHDGSRTQLLGMLRSLQSYGNVSLLATSRSIPDVVQQFILSPVLEIRANDSDVKRFVAGQIYRLPRCVQRDDELQEAIQVRISTAVDGMFLLARLHTDSLLDKGTKKKILSTLDGLPRGSKALDEAYNNAVERIEGQLPGNSTLARSVISWIKCAKRPLTTTELCHALAVEQGDLELDSANIPDVEDMVSVCAGLVVIDDESDIIRLVHYTTEEYFERTLENWNPRAQQEIASVCLTYLSFKTFADGASSSAEDFEARLTTNPFFEYAATHWAYHVLTVQEEVAQLALLCLQDEAFVDSISQMMSAFRYSERRQYIQNFPKKMIGLHLTARYGLFLLSEELLYMVSAEKSIKADFRDGHSRTPLSYAAENGHEAVVRLLIERGNVEADSKDNNGGTPLSYATGSGYEAVVRLLIERDDVKADSKDNNGRTPLSYAATNGHEAVVRLLVERDDVKADSKDTDGATPLSYAAWSGHEAVVRLLMERDDVKADSTDNNGATPLLYASWSGHEAVIRLLIERDDFEADSKDTDGRTPLSYAAENGLEAVVRLLIERDDVEAGSKDTDGRTPLSYAVMIGHEAVVRLLVERGDVEADSKDTDGRTPLSYAAGSGYEAVVRLLVERDDVKADCKDTDGRTPLSYAAGSGYEAVVRLLVERDGVAANLEDSNYQTPLSWATRGGHEAVVKLLSGRNP